MAAEDSSPLLVASADLRRLNWALAAFARSTEALIRFTDFEDLIPRICEAIVGDDDYLLSMVGLVETGPTCPIRMLGVAGRAASYVEGLNVSWSDRTAEGRGAGGEAIRTGRPLIVQDVETDERFSLWVRRARSFGIRSCVVVPFASQGDPPGILVVYSDRAFAFGDQEMDVFARLANELAFAKSIEKSRRELHQSEWRYRKLAENVSDIILQIVDDHIVYASPAIRHLGYEPEDLVGQKASWLIHPDDVEAVMVRRRQVAQGQRGGSFEFRYRRADGEWIWVESNPAPIQDEAGRITGLITVLRDVNRRKTAELARLESEARYRLLADNSSDLIRTYDLQGRITYASPSVGRYGYTPADLIGKAFGARTHPDDQPLVEQAFQAAQNGRATRLDAFQARDASGRWFWFEGQLSPLYDDANQLVGVLTVTRDITARLAAEHALGEVNAELTRVTRISTLGAFGASLAHEINQPLTALVANCQTALNWLAKTPPDVPMAQQAVKRSAQNALLASQTIARMRALVTKGPAEVMDFDINDAIKEVFALIAPERRRMKVTAKADVSPHPLMIRGDRIQIQQVLLNLLGNAIEAMREVPEKTRWLGIRSGTTDNGDVVVEIEDRGSGLDPADADHIFDHLFTTKTGGTGLGLSISKSIVELHGGRVWAEPASPNGAIFRFQLPALDLSEPRR